MTQAYTGENMKTAAEFHVNRAIMLKVSIFHTKEEKQMSTLKKVEDIQQFYNWLDGMWIGKPCEWYYGIEDVSFIFMGMWNDQLIGYQGYAINVHDVEDVMWNRYCEETEDQTEDGFAKYMQENKEDVYELLDDILAYNTNEDEVQKPASA